MSQQRRVLTGITTTGTPHLGNYVGAIRPAIAASRRADVESFYFLADYHALVKCDDPARVQQSTLEIAASWLACGLDPDKVFFYRQSDIPEIPELTWLLTCVTAKGLLNRAHAYKAAVDQNRAANEDADAGITAGLYMYPVLMAADILMFNANDVPVGRDQVQHIEIARDIAQRFNHIYGEDYFALPEASIEENVATLPGTDGRKMSKSYNNTIPLWLPAKDLKKAILGIVTDSRAPGEPKDAGDIEHLRDLSGVRERRRNAPRCAAHSPTASRGAMRSRSSSSASTPSSRRCASATMRWSRARRISRIRLHRRRAESARAERRIHRALALGRRRAQADRSRRRRRCEDIASTQPARAAADEELSREADGKFYFKLTGATAMLLLQSRGFDSPKEAGRACPRRSSRRATTTQRVRTLLRGRGCPADHAQR